MNTPPPPIEPWTLAWKQTKKFFIALFGFTLLALGIALVILPGPGWPVVLIGLAVLATEYVWARRWLHKFKEQMPAPIRTELEKKRWHWLFRR